MRYKMMETRKRTRQDRRDDSSSSDDAADSGPVKRAALRANRGYERLNIMENCMQEPEILIETLDNGKLAVSPTCIEKLERLEGQLVVVSIVGLYRTGKSYLLNRLAGKSEGFALGATVESKTKGIWIWVRPHPRLQNTHLVLLDTEGLGDAKKGDLHHDNWVFTLATLLSSTLIYNVSLCVNEEVISKLDFITEISKKIMVRKEDDSNDSEFDVIFPQFVVAVRDFSLVLEDDGREITPNEYLEGLLKLDSEKNEAYNRPRASIRKYFKNRVCFTFERPASTAKKLQKLEELPVEEITKEFLEDTDKFLKYAFANFATMKLRNGHPINGMNFGLLSTTYVKAINEGKVPCIESAFEQVVRMGNMEAMNKAIEEYNKRMGALLLPLKDDEELSYHHREAMDVALEILEDAVVDDLNESLQTEFNDKIRTAHQAVAAKDEEESTEQCKNTLEKHGRKITRKLCMKEYIEAGGYSKYKHDVKVLEGKYRKGARGVSVENVWSQYLLEHMAEVTEIRDKDQQLSDAERKKEFDECQAAEEKRNKAKLEAEKAKNKKELENLKKDIEKTEKTLQAAYEKKMEEVRAKDEELYEKRRAEEKRLLEEGFKKLAEEEKKNRERLQREIEERDRKERERKGANVFKRMWWAIRNK